ncbi:MAG: ELWxxDGT repeat protein [Planctomycetaceae bacterium]
MLRFRFGQFIRKAFARCRNSRSSIRRPAVRRRPCEALESRTLLSAALVKDIEAWVFSSFPRELTEVNGTFYFLASSQDIDNELWRTDGTSSGTVLVRDINPGLAGGAPRYLTNLNGVLYFSADDGVHGNELWTSDGTSAGTVMVKDIFPGMGDSNPAFLTNVNGQLYFAAQAGANDVELWTSDGTGAGTMLVANLNLGGQSQPRYLTNVLGTLYFTANDGVQGRELWTLTGPTATPALVEVNPGPGGSDPTDLVEVAGQVYFAASSASTGRELWSYDPLPGGGLSAWDIVPGIPGSLPVGLTEMNGEVFFAANDFVRGTELWKAAPGAGMPALVRDLHPTGDSVPLKLTNVSGTLFFSAADGSRGRELWSSDGTPTGTVMVSDIVPGAGGSDPYDLFDANGTLVFSASDGVSDREVWVSDGTSAGTSLLIDLHPTASSIYESFAGFALLNGRLLFNATSGPNGFELWSTDGTSTGTVLVRDIDDTTQSSYPESAVNVNGTLFFAASVFGQGRELWKSQGSEDTTELVADIVPGVLSSSPQNLTNVNGRLFFTADDGWNGYELWTSDGTSSGTFLVRDIHPTGSSLPQNLTNLNGILYFTARDSANGFELWRSDGTSSGTSLVADINPTGNSFPWSLTAVGNTLFFTASDGTLGVELWKSDGTSAGTLLVADIQPGGSSSPGRLTAVNGQLFFTADDGSHGRELWVTDGTTTTLVNDIHPSGSSYPDGLTDVNGTLFFTSSDGSGFELWRSDGTSAGTILVRDINAAGSSYPRHLTNVNATLFFSATDRLTNVELWRSDGTSAGTVQVADLNPAGSSDPNQLVNADGWLYFTADNGVSGYELWRSNGTASGTGLVADIAPGASDSFPLELVEANGQLFFSAQAPAPGRELWCHVIHTTPTDITLSAAVVNENSPVGTTVGTLSTTDADIGDAFTYTLVAGTGDSGNSRFSIVGNQLRTAVVPDHELQGEYSIRIRTTDLKGLSFEKVFLVGVNDLLELSAGLDRNVLEGDLVRLQTGFYNGPVDASLLSMTIDWGDGTFLEDGLLSPISGTNGGTIANTHRYVNEGAFVVTVTLTDGVSTVTDTMTLTVLNAPPSLGRLDGPEAAVRGQTLAYQLKFADPGVSDTHTAFIDWGDGTVSPGRVEERNGEGVVYGSKVYTREGTYTLSITVIDDVGSTTTTSKSISIKTALLQPGLHNPDLTDLYVGGTLGNDLILLNPSGTNIAVSVNGTVVGTYAPTGGLVVFAQAGNDVVTVASTITRPACLFGDDGADSLTGGGGNDTLTGQGGNDTVVGGAGHDTYLFDTTNAAGVDLATDSAGVDTLDFSQTVGQPIVLNLGLAVPQVVNPNLTLTLSSATAFENVLGGSGNDQLTGNSLANVLVGGPGNDRLVGGAGNDSSQFQLDPNQGTDLLDESGGGIDTLDFSSTALTAAVVDLSVPGAQTVATGRLVLTLGSSTTFEQIIGGRGNDTLTGNTLNNTLVGGAGNDTLTGGTGNDTYLFDADSSLGADTLIETGTGGIDLIDFTPTAAGVTLDLAQTITQVVNARLSLRLSSDRTFENVTGGDGNDSLFGNVLGNVILGGDGHDNLVGADGKDSLTGGSGDDTLAGGTGDDTYLYSASATASATLGSDTLVERGEQGVDLITFAGVTSRAVTLNLGLTSPQTVLAGFLNITLNDATFENVTGGSLADVLTGNAGANTLIGGPGNDVLVGGLGDDTYSYTTSSPQGTDTLVEQPDEGTDTLDFSTTTTHTVALNLGQTAAQVVNANLSLVLSASDTFENALGGSLADTLIGNLGPNRLGGNAGNDLLLGFDGHDTLEGGLGNDTLQGGNGGDTYLFDADLALGSDAVAESLNAGIDTLDFSLTTSRAVAVNLSQTGAQVVAGANLTLTLNAVDVFDDLVGGSLNDVLTGNSLKNRLVGNAGNDSLIGGAGDDILTGGLGNDAYLFNPSTPLGTDQLDESAGGLDTLDFSAAVTGVILNLTQPLTQIVHPNLSLTLGAPDTFENALGGTANDQLSGNALANTLIGNSGDDTIVGAGGNDSLTGGGGNDVYQFAAHSPLGVDTLNEAGGGLDTLDFSSTTALSVSINLGTTASQVVNVNLSLVLGLATAIENAIGGSGNDQLVGNTLANILDGGAGKDLLTGLAGNDTLVGGTGDDTYLYNTATALGSDTLVEQANEGLDTLDFSSTTTLAVNLRLGQSALQVVNANLSLLLSAADTFENARGGSLGDALTGGPGPNLLLGNAGNDTLLGFDGNDTLDGGAGNDSLQGGLGDDTYLFDADLVLGSDTLSEALGSGLDTLDFSATTTKAVNLNLGQTAAQTIVAGNLALTLNAVDVFEHATGGSQADILLGNGLANLLVGNAGNDSLKGSDADDTLVGGAGNDSLTGGAGNDAYLFNTNTPLGTDTLDEGGGGFDLLDFTETTDLNLSIDLAIAGTQVVNSNLSLILGSATTVEHVFGGKGDDLLRGNSLLNILAGSGGNDTIVGFAGDDTLVGGIGDDTFLFAANTPLGLDIVAEGVNEGFDVLHFGATTLGVTVDLASNVVQVVNPNLSLLLLAGNGFEMVVGSTAADLLMGNADPNILIGSGGDDTLLGLGGNDLLFGGSGVDKLDGGDDDDLLIPGLTSYYSETSTKLNQPGLAAIFTEWVGPNPYLTRISNLRVGVGPGNIYRLDLSNLFDDGGAAVADYLAGGFGLDWFWQFPADVISDLGTGGAEVVN